MNILQNKVDELNIELTLTISPEDYSDNKKKKLADYRKKAEIKGFRKGMVPMSLVEKMYGQQVLVDSVNEVIGESINNFIKDNDLKVLGEPLPQDNQPKNEWADGNEFTFKFDVALMPQVSLELSKEDKFTLYNITVTDEAKAEMKANMLKQYGSLADGEEAKADDFLIADFVQGENKVEGTYVALRSVAEAVRPSFVGLKPGQTIEVNVNEAFTNESDRAAMLKVSKDELATMEPAWSMTVVNVKTFVPAELNQETYDKIFGEGTVKSEEEFDAKIAERISSEYSQEADWKCGEDLKKALVEKSGVALPEAFMKKWLYATNDGKFTMEDIEKEWDIFAADFRWQLVRSYLMEKYSVKIEDADVMEAAKHFAYYQFAMYGMNNVPEEQLESFAATLLQQEKESRRILESVEDKKTLDAVKKAVTLSKKKITLEAFRELK
jgi:trigger factor